MNYNEFITFITNKMEEKMGDGYTVELKQVMKNNSGVLDSLLITEQGRNCSPNIYLKEYFEQYEASMTLEEILDDIYRCYKDFNHDLSNIPCDLSRFESVRGKVLCKLIRQSGNEQLLSDIPHLPFLDLAIVFYLLLNTDEEGQMTALIHNEHLILWRVTTEEIYTLAKENTEKALPASIVPMIDVMVKIVETSVEDESMRRIIVEGMKKDMLQNEMPLFVLSNSTNMNGAICILYPELLENFSQKYNSDIIILPSSLHETLLVPFSDDMDVEEMKEVVMRVNGDSRCLSSQDVLSDSVYIYKRENKQIEIAF